jgi:centrosomal protein CEP44
MSTGDLYNNIERLRAELRQIRYNELLDIEGLANGHFVTYRPILLFTIFKFSKLIASMLDEYRITVDEAKDFKLVEGVYRFLRLAFVYRPVLSVAQFVSGGFAERKVMF